MVINGFPALACEEKLIDHEELIELMPLQKFPVIEDLVVDRSVMFEHLTRRQVWMKGKHSVPEEKQKEAFTASLCLQCGCCLEICTSYTDGEDFFGMAALVPAATGEAAQESPRKTAGMLRKYRNHFYECCDEFHACEHVCPAKLPLTRLMAHMNRQMKQAEEMGGLEKDG